MKRRSIYLRKNSQEVNVTLSSRVPDKESSRLRIRDVKHVSYPRPAVVVKEYVNPSDSSNVKSTAIWAKPLS